MTLGRRAFLRNGVLLLAASTLDFGDDGPRFANEVMFAKSALRVGLMTDLHYADKAELGTRFYRETPGKLAEAAAQFRANRPDFLVALGDLIDAADSIEAELAYVKTIHTQLTAVAKHRHYVLGNHCVSSLTKREFLDSVDQQQSYYSFDKGDYHFIVLDACFRVDGEAYGRRNFEWTDTSIPTIELDWLRTDLMRTRRSCVVFAHQRLDVNTEHGVKNAPQVRNILESSGKVLAVFQGHSHQNALTDIGGIHYCTLRAMVEGSGEASNAFAMLEILPRNALRLSGFRMQSSYYWSPEESSGVPASSERPIGHSA